jgi:adenosylhomocysteine nucleosidase
LAVGTVIFSADEESGLAGVLETIGAKPAQFHCSSRIVFAAAEKHALFESTGADAVEMESGFIRQLCRDRRIPSATIRVISDAAGEDLPLDFNRLMTDNAEMDYGKLARALLRKPGKIPALLALQRKTRRAAQSLGQLLQELLRREHSVAR